MIDRWKAQTKAKADVVTTPAFGKMKQQGAPLHEKHEEEPLHKEHTNKPK